MSHCSESLRRVLAHVKQRKYCLDEGFLESSKIPPSHAGSAGVRLMALLRVPLESCLWTVFYLGKHLSNWFDSFKPLRTGWNLGICKQATSASTIENIDADLLFQWVGTHWEYRRTSAVTVGRCTLETSAGEKILLNIDAGSVWTEYLLVTAAWLELPVPVKWQRPKQL